MCQSVSAHKKERLKGGVEIGRRGEKDAASIGGWPGHKPKEPFASEQHVFGCVRRHLVRK